MQDKRKTKAQLLEELEALRRSEAEYRAIVEHIPAVVYTAALDQTSTTLYMSPQVGRFLGYSADEWIADHELWVKLVHPDDRDRVLAQLADSQKSGNPFCCEYRMCNPDGRTLCIRDEAVVVKDNAGRPVFLEGVMLDITSRVLAEEALRRSEAEYRAVVEHQAEFICRWLPDGRITFVNDAYCRYFGQRREEVVGQSFMPLIPPKDQASVADHFASLTPERPAATHEHRVIKPEGGIRWMQWTNRALFDSAGRVVEYQGVGRDVTDRVLAEEALRESEQRYRTLFEQSLDAIAIVADGRVVHANEAAAALVGVALDVALGRPIEEFVHADDRPRVRAHVAELAAGALPFFAEQYRIVRLDGSVSWVEVRGQAIEWEGRPAAQIVAHDVTEHRAAEEALRKSEGEKALILSSVAEHVLFQDTRHRIIWANRAAADSVGTTPDQLVGRLCYTLWHARTDPYPDCPVQKALETGQPEVAELRSEDGRCWLIRGYPVRDAEGNIAGAVEVALDVTEQRRAQEALRKSEREKDLILSSVAEEVLFQDTRHRIIWANRAAAESVGATPDQLVGRPCYTVFHPRTEPCPGCPVHKVFETGQPEVAELQTESGRYWLIKGYPIRDAEGNVTGAVEVALDITAQRLAEEERRRLEARIRDAQKLESLGVLAGGIAHDFNNLLVGILGNAGLAHLEMPPDSPLRPYCEQIERAALRARDLTNQLLAYSGKGKFQVRPANLSDLVRDTADLLRVSIPRHVALDLHLDPALPQILADATQIRQVVMNLLTNASEAIGDSPGTITLVTGSIHADRQYLAGAFIDEDIPEGDYVFLDVSDTGCGMDAETRAKIFDPFFSTKFSGRGLGLAAVLGIVRGHCGAIRVYSEPGHGTAVKVLFPAAVEQGTHEPAAPAEGAAPVPTEGFRGSGTVLVIDDEPSVRDVARAILEKVGFEVLVAASGREGLERFRAGADRIVAVLLDMTMPDLAGEEVFAELRSIRPGVPVILSSGYNEQDATRRFAPAGLAGFIQKPYLPADLLSKVRAALRV